MQRKDLCAMVLLAVLSGPLGLYAGTPVLDPEKTRLRETVLSHHTQIQNLHVRLEVTDTTDPAAASICSWEWAFSGDKRYRKRGWPYPQGSAPRRGGVLRCGMERCSRTTTRCSTTAA